MENNSEVVYLYLDDIIPNRFQPREVFNEQALKELAVSIREHGVIQPIIVRKVENKYEIIAGERRYKASTMAGLTKIPAIIKNLDDKESSKIALIENLQRKDLTPIEEARTYQKILELEQSMTQEQLAATIGKTQSSVSNKLRLLALPEEIQDALLKERISERHARSLLNLKDKNDQIKMMDKVIEEKMTVRELDKEIKNIQEPGINNEPISEVSDNIQTNKEIGENMENNMNNQDISNQNMNLSGPTVSIQDIMPTSVDIDKVRENSQDIMATTAPIVAVDDLMKKDNESDTSFRFVQSFDNNTNIEPTTAPTETNMLNQFFNPNLSETQNNNETLVEQKEDNSIAASTASFAPLTIQPDNLQKDINKAVMGIKNVITNLQSDGYNIKFDENDSDNNYKITIDIQK